MTTVCVVIGSSMDVSRARIVGQVQKVTSRESPGYLAMGNSGQTRTLLPG